VSVEGLEALRSDQDKIEPSSVVQGIGICHHMLSCHTPHPHTLHPSHPPAISPSTHHAFHPSHFHPSHLPSITLPPIPPSTHHTSTHLIFHPSHFHPSHLPPIPPSTHYTFHPSHLPPITPSTHHLSPVICQLQSVCRVVLNFDPSMVVLVWRGMGRLVCRVKEELPEGWSVQSIIAELCVAIETKCAECVQCAPTAANEVSH